MRSLRWVLVAALAASLGLLLVGPHTFGQQILQYGFEARAPVWKAGSTDAALKVLAHELTSETAHGGQRSEHIRLKVERGTYIHYTYDLPRAPINDELTVGLWLKSNRPNVQLLCRIVFPRERDPGNLSGNLTALVRCEPYQSTRWKLVDLRQPTKRLREQQRLLNHKLGREIDITGAYIDQLVLNAYDGTGVVDVWVDDLEVGPVVDSKPPTVAEAVPNSRTIPGTPLAGRRSSEVMIAGSQLKVAGKKFFLRGIRYTGTPLSTLRDAGFNTVWLDESVSPKVIEEAARLGFWMVPTIQPTGLSADGRSIGQLTTPGEMVARKAGRFLEQESVLAWYLGSNLGSEQYVRTVRLADAFRSADPQRPVIADIWEGYRGYSRSLPQLLVGTHRWPLYTSLELRAYREWLEVRRRLTVDNYSWTWVQTHLPEWYTRLIYNNDGQKGFSEAVGPQPEQIRLLAYCALSAGYRGLAFWSDRYLADSHQGRDRLLAMALLNQELRLLEPLLNQATQAPEIIPTTHKDVIAAIIRIPQAVLVLPIWVGDGSQYVPGQAGTSQVSITVPVPITSTAWEVSPGRIRSYPIKRVQGGCMVTIRNFSIATAVLFTSDLSSQGVVARLQDQQRRMARLAAQWLTDQAREELIKVEQVHAQIVALEQAQPDAQALLKKARETLERAARQRRDGEHAEAYSSADVALRSLRLLMRSHWDRAVRDIDAPVSSPYALSYFTLPQHWKFLLELKRMRATQTVLPHGDFELPPDQLQPGWILQEVPSLDPVDVTVMRVPRPPDPEKPKYQVRGQQAQTLTEANTKDESGKPRRGGKQCLIMEIKLKPNERGRAVLERTFVALHSPVVRLRPGTLVRISAWVKTRERIGASLDGALVYDSIGGEPLAFRIVESKKWRKFSLYRRVPASGEVRVTLAMSGMGAVFFDDVRIEPLEEAVAAP